MASRKLYWSFVFFQRAWDVMSGKCVRAHPIQLLTLPGREADRSAVQGRLYRERHSRSRSTLLQTGHQITDQMPLA
jgi:hypothetical protein